MRLSIPFIIVTVVLVGLAGWIFLHPSAVPPITDLVYENLIQVDAPKPNDMVSSPLIVTGKARGSWYFEASFPVKLFDGNGKELAVIPAQAQGGWMTEEFVPFKATLTFAKPETETGTLVIKNDNPSGDPANDKQITIPVRFSSATTTQAAGSISGYVHIGPTCPVMKNPPDPQCADRPYTGAAVMITDRAGKQYSGKTNTAGVFVVTVPPGTYAISVAPINTLPRCAETSVSVTSGSRSVADISCDSGIR